MTKGEYKGTTTYVADPDFAGRYKRMVVLEQKAPKVATPAGSIQVARKAPPPPSPPVVEPPKKKKGLRLKAVAPEPVVEPVVAPAPVAPPKPKKGLRLKAVAPVEAPVVVVPPIPESKPKPKKGLRLKAVAPVEAPIVEAPPPPKKVEAVVEPAPAKKSLLVEKKKVYRLPKRRSGPYTEAEIAKFRKEVEAKGGILELPEEPKKAAPIAELGGERVSVPSVAKGTTTYFHISSENRAKWEKMHNETHKRLDELHKAERHFEELNRDKIGSYLIAFEPGMEPYNAAYFSSAKATSNFESELITNATKYPTKQISYVIPRKAKKQKIKNPMTSKMQSIFHQHGMIEYGHYKTLMTVPDKQLVFHFIQYYWTETNRPAEHSFEKSLFKFQRRPEDEYSLGSESTAKARKEKFESKIKDWIDFWKREGKPRSAKQIAEYTKETEYYSELIQRHLTNEEIDHINKVLARMPPEIEK